MSDTPNDTTETIEEKAPKWVEDRIAKIAAQKSAALERVTELEAKILELEPRASSGDEWKTKATELEATIVKSSSSWGVERSMLEAGIKDSDIRELFSWQYGKLGEDRPEFGEWLKALDADNAPASLRAHLPSATATTAAVVPDVVIPPPIASVTAPRSDAATLSAPAAKQSLSADDIRGASAENWSQIRERLKSEWATR